MLADVEKHFKSNFTKIQTRDLFDALCRFPTKKIKNAQPQEREVTVTDEGTAITDEIKTLRIKQIENYIAIKKQHDHILTLTSIKDCLNLGGDFERFLQVCEFSLG